MVKGVDFFPSKIFPAGPQFSVLHLNILYKYNVFIFIFKGWLRIVFSVGGGSSGSQYYTTLFMFIVK